MCSCFRSHNRFSSVPCYSPSLASGCLGCLGLATLLSSPPFLALRRFSPLNDKLRAQRIVAPRLLALSLIFDPNSFFASLKSPGCVCLKLPQANTMRGGPFSGPRVYPPPGGIQPSSQLRAPPPHTSGLPFSPHRISWVHNGSIVGGDGGLCLFVF